MSTHSKIRHLKNLYALDMGTTKFCLATLREVPGQQAPVVDAVTVPAEGMRRGMLANLVEAKRALATLIEAAEKQFQADITRVVVGVAGSHLSSRSVTATIKIAGGAVTHADIGALVAQVEAGYDVPDRELLHAVPTGYKVDQRETVDDPVGFNGKTLTGEFFLIDCDKQYAKDLVEVCNASGLQVVRLYSEPFASATVTVPEAYKTLGIALADIGGGTTDGIVFKHGRPVGAFTVNVAGKLMTNDLAIGLSLGFDEAEVIKIRFGIKPREGDVCQVHDVKGQPRAITGEQATAVLLPRVHELGALLARELVQFKGGLGAGILLTGGGAGVHGIAEYYQKRMGIPVARAKPILPAGAGIEPEQVKSSPHATKLATVIGLLNLELCRLDDLERNHTLLWTTRYLGQFFNWIKELS